MALWSAWTRHRQPLAPADKLDRADICALVAPGESSRSGSEIPAHEAVPSLAALRSISGYALAFCLGLLVAGLWASFQPLRHALYGQLGLLALALALVLALGACLHCLRWAQSARRLARDRTEQVNALLALSPDGLVSFDRQGRVNYLNPAFRRMTASGDVALEGMDGAAFSAWLSARCLPGHAFSGLALLHQRLQDGHSDVQERIALSTNGKTLLQVTLRCSEPLAGAQILCFRDLIHETEIDAMKSEFLATAAHELRTPMASIMGFSELMQHGADPAAHGNYLAIIHAQSKVMAAILDEMLDLAHIEARRDKDFHYTLLDVKLLCAKVCQSLALPPQRALPEMALPEQPVYVRADEDKLHHALLNVLSNAYKYSPQGGPVRLTIALCSRQAAQVHIQIADQGLGMTPEQLRRVFERFYRGDSSGRHSGAGLGMSVAKEIIELHQGQIAIETVHGEGTRVSIFLPLGQP